MKVYTIRDIAEMAGVSVTTVSRVLNHRPDVNQATRKKVEEIIRDCHFVGNSNARGLKQGNEVIGVVIRGRSNPFLSSLAEAILDRADTVPENFVTEYIDERDDEFQTAVRMTRQNHVKGLIFVGSLIDERVRAIKGMDVPMVFTTVNAETAALPRASSVAVDDRASAEETDAGDDLSRQTGHVTLKDIRAMEDFREAIDRDDHDQARANADQKMGA